MDDRPRKIQITPAMEAAGCEELHWYDEGDLAPKVVAEIYRAMEGARLESENHEYGADAGWMLWDAYERLGIFFPHNT